MIKYQEHKQVGRKEFISSFSLEKSGKTLKTGGNIKAIEENF